MIKTSIGELKLSPIKENGKFVFFNDFISINSKISKGDRISIFVDGYEIVGGKHMIKAGTPATALLVVRGKEHAHTDTSGAAAIEDYYKLVSEEYKNLFYFGAKQV
jgi:hypothetical protein